MLGGVSKQLWDLEKQSQDEGHLWDAGLGASSRQHGFDISSQKAVQRNRDKRERWGENEARGQVSQFTVNLTNAPARPEICGESHSS